MKNISYSDQKIGIVFYIIYIFASLIFIYLSTVYLGIFDLKIDFGRWFTNNFLLTSKKILFYFLSIFVVFFILNIFRYKNGGFNKIYIKKSILALIVIDFFMVFFLVLRTTPFIELFDSWYFSPSLILGSEEILVMILAIAMGYISAVIINGIDFQKISAYSKLLIILFIIFGIFLCLLISIMPYVNFYSPASDVGLFNQVVWNLSRFHEPTSTIRGMYNIWADHFHPILVFLAPLYWFFKGPIVLLAAQGLIVGTGAIPVYLFCKSITNSRFLGLVAAVAYFLYPGLQIGMSFGFYPELMGPAIFSWALWFLYNNKLWGYFVMLTLWLGLKEDVSIFVIFLAIFLFFFGKKYFSNTSKIKFVALVTLTIGLAWFVIATKFIIPYFSDRVMDWAKTGNAGKGYIYFNYEYLGQTPLEVVKTVFKKPFYVFYIFTHPEVKQFTILKIISAFGPLFILSPMSIVAIPMFMETFLANRQDLWEFHFHYHAQYAAVLAIASVLAIGYLSRRYLRLKKQIIISGGFMIIFSGIFSNFLINSPFLGLRNYNIFYWKLNPQITKMLDKIPLESSVSAQDTLAPYLSSRDKIYLYPRVDGSEYIALAPSLSKFPLNDLEYNTTFCNMISKDNDYKLVDHNDIVFIFKKKTSIDYEQYTINDPVIIERYCKDQFDF